MRRAPLGSSAALLAGALLAAASLLVVRAAPPPAVANAAAPPAQRIAPGEASRHAGEVAMVCGPVVGTKYAEAVRGRPTFLDFGAAYPEETFRVVIWGAERGRFHEAPEQAYEHKHVCVTGRIELYRGKPEIVVKEPAQLLLDKVLADPDMARTPP